MDFVDSAECSTVMFRKKIPQKLKQENINLALVSEQGVPYETVLSNMQQNLPSLNIFNSPALYLLDGFNLTCIILLYSS